MGTQEDWLLRPVARGYCSYESIVNGALDLNDIATMNEAIDVETENQKRITDKMRNQ